MKKKLFAVLFAALLGLNTTNTKEDATKISPATAVCRFRGCKRVPALPILNAEPQ